MDNLKAVTQNEVQNVMGNKVSRRKFISGVSAGVGAAAAVSLAAGCSNNNSGSNANPATPAPTIYNDTDILNFALNLEYLEAEFYLRAVNGTGLAAADIGAKPGAVTGGAQVNFATPAIQAYAMEIANDEMLHVQFLRKALGSAAVDRPAIDLTGSFNAAAMAAGIGAAFNAFADENSFIVGAFTFEDVGVTAYHGAAKLIKDKGYLTAAAGILATEAYHAGEIRTILAYLGAVPATAQFLTYANQISALRGKASASVTIASSGMAETPVSSSAIVAADSNSIAYDRTTDQVLHIVYLNATSGVVSKGGFFPNGLNGNITASAF
jgi:hypothetical protein